MLLELTCLDTFQIMVETCYEKSQSGFSVPRRKLYSGTDYKPLKSKQGVLSDSLGLKRYPVTVTTGYRSSMTKFWCKTMARHICKMIMKALFLPPNRHMVNNGPL